MTVTGGNRLRAWATTIVALLSTLLSGFPSTSMVWLESQPVCADVAVTVAVKPDRSVATDLLDYRVTAGHSHGPPAAFDPQRNAHQTYYVIAGETPVLVHNTGPDCGTTFYHGTDMDSGNNFLRGAGLDAAEAAARHTDGPGGFFMATDFGDAAHFATRNGTGGVLEITFTRDALDALRGAGAVIREIPTGPKGPFFQGQEFHIPNSAFDLFNSLRESGAIVFRPAGGS